MVQEQKRGKRKGGVKDVEKKGTALCPHARSWYQNAGLKYRQASTLSALVAEVLH